MIEHTIISICKGGNGYTKCRTNPMHPGAHVKGDYYFHRLVIEKSLGRYLTANEHVHHKDGDKRNNELSNLQVVSASEHSSIHHPTLAPIKCICDRCGKPFEEIPRFYRLRKKRNKNGLIFCSISCASKYQFKPQGVAVVS